MYRHPSHYKDHNLNPKLKMKKSNPLSDFIQFIIGGCFFAAGVFLLSNQVMVRARLLSGEQSDQTMEEVWEQDLHSHGGAQAWGCYCFRSA